MPFTRSTTQKDKAMHTSQHHYHTDFNSDLEVHVTGGDKVEREFLVDQISTSLTARGFTGIHAIGGGGFDNGNAKHNPKSVFDAISEMRPDLITKDIAVSAAYDSMGASYAHVPLKFTAQSEDGQRHVFSKEGCTVKNFLADAKDVGSTDKITVSGTVSGAVLQAATDILNEMPTAEITMKVDVPAWQKPYKPKYRPPYDPEMDKTGAPGEPMPYGEQTSRQY